MKRALLFLLLLIVVLAGVGIGLLTRFDVNSYKGELVALIERQTGRKFAIDGQIHFAPSLVPTVIAKGVRMGNAAWGKSSDLAVIDRIEARVALMPLLQRRIEVKRIVIVGATLSLEMNPQGEGNWTLSSKEGSGPATSTTIFQTFAIEDIRLEKTRLRYRPTPTGSERVILIEALDAKGAGAATPVTVKFSGAYGELPLSLQGTVGPWQTLLANQPWMVDLNGRIGEAGISLRGDIARPLEANGGKLAVTVTADSLATLGPVVGTTLPALKPVSVSATVSDDGKAWHLQNFTAKLGHSTLAGDLRLDMSGKQPDIQGTLDAPLLDLTEVLPPPSRQKNDRFFSTEAFPLDALRSFSAKGILRAQAVKTHKMMMSTVEAQFTLADGLLTIATLQAQVADGGIKGHLTVDAATDNARIDVALQITGILPGQLPQYSGKHLDQARTDLTFNIRGNGRSVADMMASGNGRIVARVGQGRIPNNIANAGLLVEILTLLNPFSARDSYTTIECAVLNLDVKDGVGATRNGVGVRTDKLTVLGGGTVDFKTENIDIGAKPKPRQGIGLDITTFGEVVRLGGTLSDPHPVTNAAGVAQAGLKVGAAVATGGLSLLAEGLFNRFTADDDVCAIALGSGGLKSASEPVSTEPAGTAPAHDKSIINKAGESTEGAAKSAGEAVQGLFKKLFGH